MYAQAIQIKWKPKWKADDGTCRGKGNRGGSAAKSQLTRRFENTSTHIWYENYTTPFFRVWIKHILQLNHFSKRSKTSDS